MTALAAMIMDSFTFEVFFPGDMGIGAVGAITLRGDSNQTFHIKIIIQREC